MKKINIVRSTREFEKIINAKNIQKSKYFSVYYIKNETDLYKIGISVPKKIGNAVIRNKIKRQIKDIIDKHLNIKEGISYILITKKEILNIDYHLMKKELKLLFEKREYENE